MFSPIYEQNLPLKTMKSLKSKPSPAPKATKFVNQTYSMIKDPKYNTSVDWNQDKNLLFIKDIESFTNVVLPSLFNHRNFSSFTRQLNAYGFKRVMTTKTQAAFSHPNFIKNKPDLLAFVQRTNKNVNTTNSVVSKNDDRSGIQSYSTEETWSLNDSLDDMIYMCERDNRKEQKTEANVFMYGAPHERIFEKQQQQQYYQQQQQYQQPESYPCYLNDLTLTRSETTVESPIPSNKCFNFGEYKDYSETPRVSDGEILFDILEREAQKSLEKEKQDPLDQLWNLLFKEDSKI